MASDPRTLSGLISVGPAMLRDFEILGVRSVAQLARRNPQRLYESLCRVAPQHQDICCLDVFRAAVAQARDPRAAGRAMPLVVLEPPAQALGKEDAGAVQIVSYAPQQEIKLDHSRSRASQLAGGTRHARLRSEFGVGAALHSRLGGDLSPAGLLFAGEACRGWLHPQNAEQRTCRRPGAHRV